MKFLFVTTISDTINAFLIPHIKLIVNMGHEVDIACHIVQDLDPDLRKLISNIYNISFTRTPFSINNIKVYKKVKSLVKDGDYDIIHTHTPISSAIIRLACKNFKKTKIIYSTHGFHFFRGSPIINWFLYFPIEWLLSKYTDVLITINHEDYNRALKYFRAKKVVYLPSIGLDIDKIKKVKICKKEKRQELQIPEDAFLIVSVGEINKNKNHEVIIKAIKRLNNANIYYLICGDGKLKIYLKDLIKKLKLENNVRLLGFRKDVLEILKVSDVFAFPSKREGLGMAALEAMASGLPIVSSNVHGIMDYAKNNITGTLLEGSFSSNMC